MKTKIAQNKLALLIPETLDYPYFVPNGASTWVDTETGFIWLYRGHTRPSNEKDLITLHQGQGYASAAHLRDIARESICAYIEDSQLFGAF